MQQTSEALRAWFRRVEPMVPELFNAAYAMCGNYDLAEQALCAAVVELWAQSVAPGIGFRERARSFLREEAFAAMASPQAGSAEFTWPGLPAIQPEGPILHQALQERVELQRLILLRYGCGLSVRSVSQLTGVSPAKIRVGLERFEARCRRSVAGADRNRVDALVGQCCQQLLTRNRAAAPSAARVYRAFEAEASKSEAASRRLPQIIGRACLLLLAAMCAVLFWVFAVLVQPEAVVDPAAAEPAAVVESADR